MVEGYPYKRDVQYYGKAFSSSMWCSVVFKTWLGDITSVLTNL